MRIQQTVELLAALALSLLATRTVSAQSKWCAPGIEAIKESVCYFNPAEGGAAPNPLASRDAGPPASRPRTLVFFLHGLVGDGSDWQWEQQRMMARMAKNNHVAALMPRGRLRIGPGRDPKTWAWPTSRQMQDEYEAEILAEWEEARTLVEQRDGRFERVLVFGFSNGAYYASSLALRGRLEVDGYGVFAGGSGGKYSQLLGERTTRRAPVFVGYGTKDPDHKNQRELAATLKKLGWKHRVMPARVGHTVTNAQIAAAVRFLSADELESAGAR